MPLVSFFDGIRINIYFADHGPPHFHASQGNHSAVIRIDSGKILAGYLPSKSADKVEKWRVHRLHELEVAWRRARHHELPGTIEPLK